MEDQTRQLQWRDPVAAAVAAVTMAVFLPAWWAAFVFDDAHVLTWCDGHPDWSTALRTLLQSPWRPAAMLPVRPVQQASFELQCWMTGGALDPTFPMFNVVLHAANTWLLLVWVHNVLWLANTGKPALRLPAATVTALWWGCHPLLATSVDYVVQRANLLTVLGMFAALAALTQGLRAGWNGWRLLAVLVGLWVSSRSKEWGVVSVAALVLVFVVLRPPPARVWVPVGALGMVFGTWVLWPTVVWRLKSGAAKGDGAVSWSVGAWSQLRVFFLQLQGLAWPRVDAMSVDHPWNPLLDGGGALHAVALVCLLLLGLVAWWRGLGAAAVALLLLVGSQLPYLVSPGTEFLVDYKAYLLAPGLALGLAALGAHGAPWVAAHLAVTVALSTQLLAVHLLHSNAVTLWRHAAAQPHVGARAHHNLAVALWKEGAWPEAQALLERVVKESPRYPNAWENLAELRAERDLHSAALDAANQALALRPHSQRARLLAVRMAAELGDLPTALSHARLLWAAQPPPGEAGSWLVWLLALDGQMPQAHIILAQLELVAPEDRLIAAALLDQDIRLDVPCRPPVPVPAAHRLKLLLADLRANAGELHVAVSRFTRLMEQEPLLATELMVRLAQAEGARHRNGEASRWLDQALERCPGHGGALQLRQLLTHGDHNQEEP